VGKVDMKFICTQENLLGGLTSVSPLAGRNSQLPALQHTLIEVRDGALNLTCTDLEVGARVVVGGKAEGDGGCTVVARQLLEYVQQLPTTNPITLENKQGRLRLTTKGFSAQFPVGEVDDFPLLPTSPQKKTTSLDGSLLSGALARIIFAAARDEARPEIHSVFMSGGDGGVRLAGTDSFRLAEYILPVQNPGNFSFLLPVSTAQEVSRLFAQDEHVDLLQEENYVVFRNEGLYVSSRLVDGTYPDYQQIIPTTFVAEGIVRREDFLRALKILNVFLPRDSRRVALAVNPTKGFLKFRVEGSESGQGEVTVDFDGQGKQLDILFNVNYLIDGAAHTGGDELLLKFGGKSDPVVLSPQGDQARYLYIVMPIQA
jgi:DNA polymerase-3 subunit beta